MMPAIYVAIGGCIGALARFWLSQQFDSAYPSIFPWATMIINVTGSLCIGILFVLVSEKAILSQEFRYLLMIGLLGGFTTYSAFSLETVLLIEKGELITAMSYAVSTLFACLAAVWLGIKATRILLSI